MCLSRNTINPCKTSYTRTRRNPIKTTNGKGTTPKSTFISLAKGIAQAEKGALVKWHDAYREFVRSGATDKLAWATEWATAVKGTAYDTNTVATIRVNLSHIEWAEQNVIGGAKACGSIAHIIKTKSGKGDKSKSEPRETVSLTLGTCVSLLTRQGYSKQEARRIGYALGLK